MSGLTRYSKTYKPFAYPWAMQLAEQHEKIHWGTWEAKLQEDLAQWKNGSISEAEKSHITQILRIFTQSDVAVGGNYCDIFIPQFRNNEIRNMLLSFANREGTHQRAYALLNDTLGLDESEYAKFLDFKEMSDRLEHMSDDLRGARVHGDKVQLAYDLAKSVCNEGMALFSAFVMLLNFQRFGKMRGMSEIVEWSVKDETIHVEGMTRLFKEYLDENPELKDARLYREIENSYKKAVVLEESLIDLVFEPDEILSLRKVDVKKYIRYLADRRLIQLGIEPLFGVKKNPLPWLDWVVSGDSLKNFFEGTVTDYNAAGMEGQIDWSRV